MRFPLQALQYYLHRWGFLLFTGTWTFSDEFTAGCRQPHHIPVVFASKTSFCQEDRYQRREVMSRIPPPSKKDTDAAPVLCNKWVLLLQGSSDCWVTGMLWLVPQFISKNLQGLIRLISPKLRREGPIIFVLSPIFGANFCITLPQKSVHVVRIWWPIWNATR